MRDADMDPNGDHDMLDMAMAKRLLESGAVREAAGFRYHDSVKACLTHQAILASGEVTVLNSRNVGFQLDLEQAVITPIREYYINSWGQTS